MIRLENNIDGSIIATIEGRFIGLEFLKNWTYRYGGTIWKGAKCLVPVIDSHALKMYGLVDKLVESGYAQRLNYEQTAELVSRDMVILSESMINKEKDNG